MTTTAQSIVRDAQILLQDPDGIRWGAPELVGHLNDGQREILVLRPDLLTIGATLALAAGARQVLPSNCHQLVDIPRNTSGVALRKVERSLLDAVEPNWYSKTAVAAIKHFTHDAREPLVFWVYPPAAPGASVDLIYAAYPVDVGAPSGATAATVTGAISTPDNTKNALLHFVLARAFMKDAEFGGDAVMSAAHLQLFKAELGIKTPAPAPPR